MFAYVDWKNRRCEEYKRLLAALSVSESPAEQVKEIASSEMTIARHKARDVSQVAMTVDGQTAILGDDYGELRFFDLRTGSLIHSFRGHRDTILGLDVSSDGTTNGTSAIREARRETTVF